MKRFDCAQRSPEWVTLRLGMLTGSRVGDAFAKLKGGGEAAGRRNLRTQLVLERLVHQSQENGYMNADMERGIELEPEARAAYEAQTGILSESVGFVAHDELLAGCSPDGLTADGLIEIKCPRAAIHLEYIRGGLPLEYKLQVLHALWLTNREWGDFVSYSPAFPEHLRLKITRLFAKDLDLKAHELNVRLFLTECDKEYDALVKMTEQPA